ncbi:Zinc metalloproteinase aureolysin precursor [compost metagenome]
MIQHSSQIPLWGESGALVEHFADLFGEMAEQLYRPTQKKWLIGEDILTPATKKNYSEMESRPIHALRDMLNPGDGFDRQPSHYSQVPFEFLDDCVPAIDNDACGVHVMNGIPNRAAALIISQLGWEKVKWIYFNLMTERLKSSYLGHEPKFADYSRELLQLCSENLEAQDCDVVLAALKDVGLR